MLAVTFSGQDHKKDNNMCFIVSGNMDLKKAAEPKLW